MPTYVYRCEKCGHTFETVQSIAAKPLATCPEELCGQKRWGKGPVRREISGGAGLIFKGSGFYITDYRSENYKQAARKDSAAPVKSDSKPSGGDSKPAAKSEPKAATAPAKP